MMRKGPLTRMRTAISEFANSSEGFRTFVIRLQNDWILYRVEYVDGQ